MKTDTINKWILLEQSGELDLLRAWLLRRELARNAEARSFRDDLLRIASASRALASDSPAARATLAAIMEEAERHAAAPPRPAQEVASWTAWRPAYAVAILALSAGALWLLLQRPDQSPATASTTLPLPTSLVAAPEWDDGLDTELTSLDNEISLTSSDWVLAANASELDALANDVMEGTQI